MNIYFPALTDDELLRYGGQYATTDLEKALVERFELLHANPERISMVEMFKDAVWTIADNLSESDGIGRKASKALFNEIQIFEGRQA